MGIRDMCPGYDVIGKTPIGYSVSKDVWFSLGVIHQWTIVFQKGRVVYTLITRKYIFYKYSWQRVFENLLSTIVGAVTSRRI